MPALSKRMIEGTLGSWLVKVSDQISMGDVLAIVETESATIELEALSAGTVLSL